MSAPTFIYPPASTGGTPVGGSGTPGTIPVWNTGTTLGDSGLIDDGSVIYTTARNAAFGSTSSAGYRARVLAAAGAGSAFGLRIDAGTNSTDYALRIANQATTSDYLAVRGDGNVGIGTASPGFRLDVLGTGTSLARFSSVEYAQTQFVGGTQQCYIQNWTGYSFLTTSSSSRLQLGTNNLGALTIDPSQNVGIGTASPLWKNHTVGAGVALSGTSFNVAGVSQDQSLYRGVSLGYDTSGQIGMISATTSGAASSLAFWTYSGSAWGERARIDSSGRLLVGTATAPAATGARGVFTTGTVGTDCGVQINSGLNSGGAIINSVSGGGLNFFTYTGAIGSEVYASRAVLGPTVLDISATAGYGLKLPATPGNADTQTLDAYQENTGWVPGISFGGGTTGITYTTQTGSWTRIGNLVFVTGRVTLSNKGSSTGVARITNLPATVGASSAAGGGGVGAVSNITFGGQLALYPVASQTVIGLVKNASAGAAADLTDADFTNTSDISFSLVYRV
jgi:hypothetical protein